MTRVTESQLARGLINEITRNKVQVDKYSNEVSTGIKVTNPGDTDNAGTLSQFQYSISQIKGNQERIKGIKGSLEYQDNVLASTLDLITRAKEIATQGANETVGSTIRAQMAEEVLQIRDHIASFANSTYQGRYIFAGNDNDDPPYDQNGYTSGPLLTNGSKYYKYDNEFGTANSRTVTLSDDVSITVNTPGNKIFDTAMQAVERLAQALKGSSLGPATGNPDGTSTAYTFPTDYKTQTDEIRKTIDLLNTASATDIQVERVSLGGRLRRLDTASSILNLSQISTEDSITNIQTADIAESATNLNQAKTALDASYAVTTKVLGVSILDYI